MPAGVVLGEMQTWQASSWDTFNRFFGKSTSVGSLCSDGPANLVSGFQMKSPFESRLISEHGNG